MWDPTLSKPSHRGSPDYIKRTCLLPVIFTHERSLTCHARVFSSLVCMLCIK